MKTKLTYAIAAALLICMSAIAFFSMKGDSAIMDEVAHLPAGYSYITQGDMRLNAEHPPLIKDLSGLAVLAWSKISGNAISFPSDIKAWTQDINGQWDFGFNFLYSRGNPADTMILAGRLPMLLILIILGIYIFIWTRQLWGKKAALIALFFFAFSPTFLAHGRFVTTDVAAAAAFFISSYYFFKWLKDPKILTVIAAGIFFGLAQTAKFSLFLIVPYFVALTAGWIIAGIIKKWGQDRTFKFLQNTSFAWRHIWGLIVILAIGYAFIVTPLYIFHVKNYPAQRQLDDMENIMASYGEGSDGSGLGTCVKISRIKRCPAELTIAMTKTEILPLRAFGQYMLGLLMVVQRAAGGNTTYFMGQVSNLGWSQYFPTVYALKEPLAFHILSLAAFLFAIWRLFRKKESSVQVGFFGRLAGWFQTNFISLGMLFFIVFYWFMSVRSPLNIGVRHVLPTFPFIFALTASQIGSWINSGKKTAKTAVIGLLLAWQAVSVIMVYPSFLAYFNEMAGGAKNGHKYAVDSNLDWGQDLKRLAEWTDKQNIQKIYLDYFGGGMPNYYLGDKFQGWWGDRNPQELKSGDWLAVSATFLMGGQGKAVPFYKGTTGYYDWLKEYQPKAIIGHSIFVFQKP